MEQKEYWDEIASLAGDIRDESRSGEHGTGEDCREWLMDYVHELIDGHEWIIYTYQAKTLLQFTRNENYTAENFGAESMLRDGSIHWEGIAFGAMYGDLMDELSKLDGFDVNDPNPDE